MRRSFSFLFLKVFRVDGRDIFICMCVGPFSSNLCDWIEKSSKVGNDHIEMRKVGIFQVYYLSSLQQICTIS